MLSVGSRRSSPSLNEISVIIHHQWRFDQRLTCQRLSSQSSHRRKKEASNSDAFNNEACFV